MYVFVYLYIYIYVIHNGSLIVGSALLPCAIRSLRPHFQVVFIIALFLLGLALCPLRVQAALEWMSTEGADVTHTKIHMSSLQYIYYISTCVYIIFVYFIYRRLGGESDNSRTLGGRRLSLCCLVLSGRSVFRLFKLSAFHRVSFLGFAFCPFLVHAAVGWMLTDGADVTKQKTLNNDM